MACISSVHFSEIFHGSEINLNGDDVIGREARRVENREQIV